MKILSLKTLVLLWSYFFISLSASGQHFIVSNANESGPGSLRQAIIQSNTRVGLDSISFNLPGPDYTIDLDSGLTQITDDLIIDATTQPGFTDEPIIIINGKGWNSYALASKNSVAHQKLTVRGLQFSNFWKSGAVTSGSPWGLVHLAAEVLTVENNSFKDIGTSTINYGYAIAYLMGSKGSRITNNLLGKSRTSTSPADIVYGHAGFFVIANGTTITENEIGYFTGDGIVPLGTYREAIAFIVSSQSWRVDNTMIFTKNKIGLETVPSVKQAVGVFYDIEQIESGDVFTLHKEYHQISENFITGCEMGGFIGKRLYNLVTIGPGNSIKDCNAAGIMLAECNYGSVVGNHIENNAIGILLTPRYGMYSRKVRIGGYGINEGNILLNNKTNLTLELSQAFISITNNAFTNTASPNSTLIFNGAVSDCIVESNTFTGTGDTALRVTNNVFNNVFKNNTIEGFKNGLVLHSGAYNNTFTYNSFLGNLGFAVDQQFGSYNNVFTNNSFTNYKDGFGVSNGSNGNFYFKNSIQATETGMSIFFGSNANKISQTSIVSNAPFKAIDLNLTNGPGNNSKDTASITGHTIAGNILTLSGTGLSDDSIEVFVSVAAGETALTYAGHTKVGAAGTWTLDISKGSAWSPTSDYYYVSTATDGSGNTSQLSKPHFVPKSLPCECIVYNSFDTGPGTLREAIKCSNATAGKDTIRFQIPGSEIHTIHVLSSLPELIDTVFIDGFSQSGGYNIVLDGDKKGFPGFIFWDNISATKPNGSKVEGLVIQRFGNGILASSGSLNGIEIQNCKLNNNQSEGILFVSVTNGKIVNNQIFQNGSNGIYCPSVTNCTIQNNLIHSNQADGIYAPVINSSLIKGNTVHSNKSDGIYLVSNFNNCTIEKNKIYNNTENGISLTSGGKLNSVIRNNIYSNKLSGIISIGSPDTTYIEENLIGTDSAFTDKGNLDYGIKINNPSHKHHYIRKNTIGFNGNGGIYVVNMDTLYIEGNYIGTNSLNQNLGNKSKGIELIGSTTKVKIGNGTAEGTNYISYNQGDGIQNQYGLNEFNRNIFVNNTGLAINLFIQYSTWGNNSKKTPHITKSSYNNGEYTLTIFSEASDTRVEIYQGDATYKNALQFITDEVVHIGGGVWEAIFNWPNPNEIFTVTATGASDNTSQLGYSLSLVVTNTNDSGPGSLRFAIENASLYSDTSLVTFNIPGNGPHVINPQSELPVIKYSTIIDGSTDDQIVLDGTGLGSFSKALSFGDGSFVAGYKSSVVKKLKIKKFRDGVYVWGHDVLKVLQSEFETIGNGATTVRVLNDSLFIDNSTIFKCGSPIGIDGVNYNTKYIYASNSIVDSCSRGFAFDMSGRDVVLINNKITNSAGNGISGNFGLNSLKILNNHISGHALDGISLMRTGQIPTIIKGNTIGLTLDQKNPLPNKRGIYVDFNSPVIIDSNYISSNLEEGVYLSRVTGYLTRNYIGTNSSWENLGNGKDGINAAFSNSMVKVGGQTKDSSNFIGNNNGHGISLRASSIRYNYIGVSPAFSDMGNKKSGVKVESGGQIEFIGNYIGFNLEHGIDDYVSNTHYNNYIGGDSVHDFGNKKWGITNFYNGIIKGNTIANNDSGAVKVISWYGKISQNNFYGTQPKAIWLNNGSGNQNKQPAAFTTPVITPLSVTLSGTGVNGDTVEIFSSSALPEIANRYLGYAVVSGGTWTKVVPSGPGYNPLQNNYYVNTATNSTGNTSQLSPSTLVPVHVCPMPALNTLASQVGICKDDSVLVDAVINNVAYKWYYNNTVIATTKQAWLKKGGDVRLEVEDSFGCFSKDTIKVKENLLPLKADFLMPSEAGKGDKVVVVDISFSKPDSVVWNFGNASTIVKESDRYVLTYATTGTYQVTATSYLGTCSKVATHYIQIGEQSKASPDGVVYPYVIKNVTIGPNPSNGVFVLTTELAREGMIKVDIFNGSGLLLQSRSSLTNSFTHVFNYDLSSLTGGTYILRVTSGKDTRVLRILKQ